jgi:hypothetical protein
MWLSLLLLLAAQRLALAAGGLLARILVWYCMKFRFSHQRFAIVMICCYQSGLFTIGVDHHSSQVQCSNSNTHM